MEQVPSKWRPWRLANFFVNKPNVLLLSCVRDATLASSGSISTCRTLAISVAACFAFLATKAV